MPSCAARPQAGTHPRHPEHGHARLNGQLRTRPKTSCWSSCPFLGWVRPMLTSRCGNRAPARPALGPEAATKQLRAEVRADGNP